ncbi:MAG: glycosyltransferase family 2 protein [Candidatus Aenigmatarchaeota archaeon]
MKENERITVAIPTYNRSIELTNLLISLIGQSYQNFDVVIYDDSETPTQKYPYFLSALRHLEKTKHKVVYKWGLQDNQRKGVAFARNQTTKLADTEYIVRIDDDSILDKNYLLELVEAMRKMEEKHGVDSVAAVGGVVPQFGEPFYYKHIDNEGEDFIFNKIELDKEGNCVRIHDHGGYSWDYTKSKIIPCHHIRSTYMYKKSIHDEVGGHPTWTGDTGFREETILTNKFSFHGYKIFMNLDAICWHDRGESGGCRAPQFHQKNHRVDQYWRFKWMPKMVKRYGNPFSLYQ